MLYYHIAIDTSINIEIVMTSLLIPNILEAFKESLSICCIVGSHSAYTCKGLANLYMHMGGDLWMTYTWLWMENSTNYKE